MEITLKVRKVCCLYAIWFFELELTPFPVSCHYCSIRKGSDGGKEFLIIVNFLKKLPKNNNKKIYLDDKILSNLNFKYLIL